MALWPFLHKIKKLFEKTKWLNISVGDGNPDPDLQDPHVFGPPGSGSILEVSGMDPDLDPSLFSSRC